MGNPNSTVTGSAATPGAGHVAVASKGPAIASLTATGPRTIVTPYQISADSVTPVAGPAHFLQIVEDEIESAIESRTEALNALRELGPPDLVHLVKQSVKSGGRQTGVYHHVTGVDASSSATLAAYLNTLIYSQPDKTQKVISGIYCCYNAFSRLDMRVDVKIPGGVESYCIDERGDKREASEALWLETFLCGVLRAYAYADDGSGDSIKRIIGVRRFDPIMNTEVEHKFLDAAERLFFKGWQLGSEPEIQVPNLVSNHLTTGLLNYIHTTGRYTSGINLFEKLRTRDPEISSLLARVLISADEEVQAVKLLHDAIDELPMDYALLDCQSTFCQSKGRLEMALECAERSVTAAPSEFGTWAKLAEIYVGLEHWDLALLTLNSCPMFTYQDKDAPRMPEPARVLLPILPETVLDELDESAQDYDAELVHPSLRKLHAAGHKGTFLKAYSLLTEITSKIGWDQLLKIRSQVFVMEEEYRSEKQTGSSGNKNASTTALRHPSPSPDADGEPATNHVNGQTDSISTAETAVAEDSADGDPGSAMLAADKSIEKPEHTITSEEAKAGSADPDPTHTTYTHFRNKRLCERWLDNLFMVLYEDLRIYTIWRTDMARSAADASNPNSPNNTYQKSAEEWEILGDLAKRLHHDQEAVEAYQHCLRVRFSPKAMKGVMAWYEKQGKYGDVLQAIIRLVAWQYRWYSEFSPNLFRTVRKLIENEGAVKGLAAKVIHQVQAYAPGALPARFLPSSRLARLFESGYAEDKITLLDSTVPESNAMATTTRSAPRPNQPPGKRQRLDSLKNPQRRSLSSLLTSRQGIQAGPESTGQCPTCQDNDVGEEDGHIVCHACGTVISESNIVSEIQFAETSGGGHLMIGQHVGSDQAHARSGLLGLKNAGGSDSREHSLANGRRYINQIGAALCMSDSLTKGAMNVYTLAVANNFIQGRQTRSVAAVCLYIATRLLDTNSSNSRNIAKFMLIDFADILQLNVFKLGHIYKDLVDELRLNGPNYQIRPLNPENLIHRFAEKLEFDKDQETAVAIDAVRILQRMNRDWMTPGRRPAGVCGAALIIAARMHNYRRTVREMVYVAKVTEATLVKRLEEFKRTESSGLTVEEFRRIDLERFCDPPSFYEQDLDKRRNKRKRRHVEFDDDGDDDPEPQVATSSPAVNAQVPSPAPTQQQTQIGSQNMPPPPPPGTSTPTSSSQPKRGRPPKVGRSAVEARPSASLPGSTEAPLEPDITTAMSDPSSRTHASALTQVLDGNVAPASPPATQDNRTQNTPPAVASTEEISDSEFGIDSDLQEYLLAPAEVEIKTRIWTHENRDWIKAEHAKELKRKIAEANGTLPNVKRRKRRRTRMGDMASYRRENQEGDDDDDVGDGDGEEDNMPAGSPAEAVAKMLKKRAYSKKINYEFLQEIYQPSSQGSSASGSRRQSMSALSDAAASPRGGDNPTAAVEKTPLVGTTRPGGTDATMPGRANSETRTGRASPEALDDIQEIAREEEAERGMLDPGRTIGLPGNLDEDEAEGEEDEPGDYFGEEDDAAEDDDDDDEEDIEDILRNAKDKAGADDEYDY